MMNKIQFGIELEKVIRQIVNHYKPAKIFLFGSGVSGRLNENSDIDLLIIKESKKRRVDRIGDILNLVERKLPLDPLVYTPLEFKKRLEIGDPFLKEVLSTSKVVYEKN